MLKIRMAALLLIAMTGDAAMAAPSCLVGAYGAGTEIAALTETNPPNAPGTLRFTGVDGSNGALTPRADGSYAGILWTPTGKADAVLSAKSCDSGEIAITIGAAPARSWARFRLRETPVTFTSDGATLRGRLIEPDAESGAALTVLVHGSENSRAIGVYSFPYLLAAQGVAALVYDKRGTGSSEGTYSQNFERLAKDAAVAADTARHMAGNRYRRIGFFGASQGGWIAPLAARKTAIDFVMVAYGLIETTLGEDAEQVADELRRKGYGEDVIAKARIVTDATGAVVASHFTAGFDRLEAIKRRYGGEPWFGAFEGEYSGPMLREPPEALRASGRDRYDNLDIIWKYDAYGTLKALAIPQLWMMAVNDIEAPSAHSIAQLRQLQRAGKPIDLAVFPDVDHGIREYQVEPDGTRRGTRFAAGYFPLIADWMKGTLKPSYGRSIIELAPSSNARP